MRIPGSIVKGQLRNRACGERRGGMTLLEVLLAMAIFLFSLLGISQLFNTATNQATDIQFESRATRLAQSKLAEYIAGVSALSGSSGTFADEQEAEWSWRADVQSQGSAQGLYLVTITVFRDVPNKGHVETALTQYVLDPQTKGVVLPQAVAASTTTTSSSDTSSASSLTSASASSSGGSMSGSSKSGSGASGGASSGSSGGASSGARSGGAASGAMSGSSMGGGK